MNADSYTANLSAKALDQAVSELLQRSVATRRDMMSDDQMET